MDQDQLDRQTRELKRFLSERDAVSVSASAGGNVDVTMNARFKVTNVRLEKTSLAHAEVAALEKHIADAVNGAFAKLSAALAERLARQAEPGSRNGAT